VTGRPDAARVVAELYETRLNDARAAAEVMWDLAVTLHSLSLTGDPRLTRHRKVYKAMHFDPVPGDLVWMWLIRHADRGDAVGRYLRTEDLPLTDPDTGEVYFTDTRYVIERWGRPGDEYGWTNARMLRMQPLLTCDQL
jgi:hypothetical protein